VPVEATSLRYIAMGSEKMRTTTADKFNSNRLLRLENLEDRQMLSATPLDSVAAAAATSALIATNDFSDEVVNLDALKRPRLT